jgi:hypothetical protein
VWGGQAAAAAAASRRMDGGQQIHTVSASPTPVITHRVTLSCYHHTMFSASCVLPMLLPSKHPITPEPSQLAPLAAAQSWQAEASGAASARAASRRLGDLDDLLEGLYEEDLGARGAAAGRIALLFRDLNNFEVCGVGCVGGRRGAEGGECR